MTKYSSLPDSEKRRVCLDLLNELGVRNLKESGDELIHSCSLPFGSHANGDSSPSASLNWRKMVFNCFGCGGRGGLAWFVATVKGQTSSDAKNWIAEQTGLGGVQDVSALISFLDSLDSPDAEAPIIPTYDPKILESWMLIHPYLTEFRKIPVDNIVHSCVGFDGSSIIIPHFWDSKLVGWQARRLLSDQGPKYKSTPSFPKDRTLFNFDRSQRDVVIVESPMSVVSKRHLVHVEATFGASITNRQCDLIASHSGKIILFFDNDEAGWAATDRVGSWLVDRTSQVFVVNNPFAADAADMDDATYCRLVSKNLIPFILWSKPSDLKELPDGVHKVFGGEAAG